MIILAFILLALAGVIAFMNMEMIAVNLYFTIVSLPMWGAFISFIIAGMVIAFLFAASKGAHDRQEIRNKTKEIKRMEKEKEEAINRIKQEKEESIHRVEAEKEEALRQAKKESNLQLELQNREAEIQNLESRLAKEKENRSSNVDIANRENIENQPPIHSDGSNIEHKEKLTNQERDLMDNEKNL
ncbi:MAG: lipopolysaccharide assembly protein LapA domain-containing protein, partial [Atopostipes suicloacalis]|nr:lipopolysaccharide assembly protein LapA domain-containing protein [Atopostipes suicloacalis]